ATVISYSSAMKFDIEDVLIQSGLHKACWKCGKSGHVKRSSPGGAVYEKDSEASASNVSLILGDDIDLI
ncbi:F-box/kelch-repeat protein, partial [Trifolium medium]|nr:F-box/kelch-repeat protein [Trifolium medium]